jgi:hypothetical protein
MCKVRELMALQFMKDEEVHHAISLFGAKPEVLNDKWSTVVALTHTADAARAQRTGKPLLFTKLSDKNAVATFQKKYHLLMTGEAARLRVARQVTGVRAAEIVDERARLVADLYMSYKAEKEGFDKRTG